VARYNIEGDFLGF